MRRRVKIYPAEKEVAPQRKVWYDTPRDKQRYRSGHNGADSKFRRDLGISSPRKLLLIPGFQNSKSNTFMFSLLLFSPKDFASQKQAKIYGDVPKRLKGPHSKCGRSAQTDARVRISPSPPPKKPVIKPIMGFFLYLFLRVSDQSRLLFFSPDFRLSPPSNGFRSRRPPVEQALSPLPVPR